MKVHIFQDEIVVEYKGWNWLTIQKNGVIEIELAYSGNNYLFLDACDLVALLELAKEVFSEQEDE